MAVDRGREADDASALRVHVDQLGEHVQVATRGRGVAEAADGSVCCGGGGTEYTVICPLWKAKRGSLKLRSDPSAPRRHDGPTRLHARAQLEEDHGPWEKRATTAATS